MSDTDNQNPENLNPEKKDLPPMEDFSMEDLPDDAPKVSIAKKKNAVLLFGAIIIFVVVMYSLLTKTVHKNQAKSAVKTELEEMKPENMVAGKTSKANADAGGTQGLVSASAASVGSNANLNPLQARQSQIQETLPPPPTLPPVVNPSSIYIRDQDSGVAASLAGSPQASLEAFGQKYTKARTRLPEVTPSQQAAPENLFGDNTGGAIGTDAQSAVDADKKARVSANMFVVSGTDSGGQDGTATTTDDYKLAESSAAFSEVGIRKDLERVILQGKVMEAVLETAINTDLPGKLRGIISRDVYSEDGKRVVIPKGSRIIGSYSTEITFGQARVYVIWNRIIRPDGIDAVIGGEDLIATDSLGRTGVYGQLDNRFFEIFGSSILLSTLTVAFAVAADAASGSDSSSSTTTTNSSTSNGSSTTTTSDPVSEGVRNAITKVGADTAKIAAQMFKNTPRITVDQGTRLKIFVNKDLLFPPSYFFNGNSNTTVKMVN